MFVVNAETISSLKQGLIAEAKTLGFAVIGFAPAQDDPLRGQRLDEWLAAGFHGSMEWMKDRADVRRGPNAMWPEARSVIALGMCYAPDHDPLALEGDAEKARISVYAQGRDYHAVMKKAQKALARWMVAEGEKIGLRP